MRMSEWHNLPFAPGREYYGVGNRFISGIVQMDKNGFGAPITLIIQDPGSFNGHMSMKEHSYLFTSEDGLNLTALTVYVDGRPFQAVQTNTAAGWKDDGTPIVHVTWWAGPLCITETLFASVTDHAIYRIVDVVNKGEFACEAKTAVTFIPNQSIFSPAKQLHGHNALGASGAPGCLGLAIICSLTENSHTNLEPQASIRDGYVASLKWSEIQPGASCRGAYAYTLYATADEWDQAIGRVSNIDLVLVENQVRHKRYQASLLECADRSCQHIFNSAVRGIWMSTSNVGRLNVGMWQYNKEWVRDSCQVALGAIYSGLHEETELILRRVLDHLVDNLGRTAIADVFVDEEHEQFDQAGQLLYVLSQYYLWTGNTELIKSHWDKISAVADRVATSPCLDPEIGLLRNRREFWERSDIHGFTDGYELAYQMWAALGLMATRTLVDVIDSEQVRQHADAWVSIGENIWHAAVTHATHALVVNERFTKRKDLDGSVQERLIPPNDLKLANDIPLTNDRISLINPDTSTVLPIIYRLIDPQSNIAQNTVADMEKLWNLRWNIGGYDRYHTSSEPDTPGPWGFASMFVARANHVTGNLARALRTIRWFTQVTGGSGGAWHEYIPIIHTDMEKIGLAPGIVLWIWAEMAALFIRDVLGVTPNKSGVSIHPRLYAEMGLVKAAVPIRGHRLELDLNSNNTMKNRCRVDNGSWIVIGAGTDILLGG